MTPATTGSTSAPPVQAPPPPAYDQQRFGGSESPRPGSMRATAEPPKERKRRGKADKDGESSTPKPVKERKERKQPAKRGAAKAALVEKEEQDRSSVAPMPAPVDVPQAPPFKAPSNWPPPSSSSSSQISHRPNRSVDEDYDEEEPEEHNGAAAALMGLAGYRTDSRPSLPPPPAVHGSRSASGGLQSLLNGPSNGPAPRGPVDRVRTPPVGRTGTPLKRGAADEHSDAADRKRSRLDSNGSSSSNGSPPGQGHAQSPSNSTRGPAVTQSRRTSVDSRSDSNGRRSWVEGPEQTGNGKASPAQDKSHPPIATLSPPPDSPSLQKQPSRMDVDGPKVPSPPAVDTA